MHWITKPGTSVAEERRIVTQVSRELRAIPGVRNFGSHIGQALLADEVYGVNFGENWISIDPRCDYDETLAAIEEVVNGYPGLFRNVETYLNERIDEVLTGIERDLCRAHLWTGLEGHPRQGGRGGAGPQGDPRHRRFARAAPVRGAADPGRGQPGQGATLWPQARRCAPGGGHLDVRRRGRRPLQRRQGLRRERVEHARNAPQPRQIFATCRSTRPTAGMCVWATWPMCAFAPAQSVIYRENASRRIDVSANVEDADLGAVMDRCQQSPRARSSSRSGTTPRCSASMPSGRPPSTACCSFAIAAVHRRVPDPAGLVRQHAPGDPRLLDVALGAGGRLAGGVLHRRRHLARLARRFPHGLRHRGPQQDHADQPLSASRESTKAKSSVRTWRCAAPSNGFRRS